MQHRTWIVRIEDIIEAIETILQFTNKMSLEALMKDRKTRDAVLRNLQLIGEAARHVPKEIEAKYEDIPWHKMRGIRNVIAHQYFDISTTIIWSTVNENLPPLLPQLKKILEKQTKK